MLKDTKLARLKQHAVENSKYATDRLRQLIVSSGLRERACEQCGLSEWLGSYIPLELHHINGVANDHRLENVQILCPNCHSQTDTWRGNKHKLR